jgi:hypothetical protein
MNMFSVDVNVVDVISRKAITETIYFLNGEQRVIEFDSAGTCGEVSWP